METRNADAAHMQCACYMVAFSVNEADSMPCQCQKFDNLQYDKSSALITKAHDLGIADTMSFPRQKMVALCAQAYLHPSP